MLRRKLWKVRSDIRISAGYTGEPAEGYVVDSVTTVPETFSVAGSEEALNNLKLQGNTIILIMRMWIFQERAMTWKRK